MFNLEQKLRQELERETKSLKDETKSLKDKTILLEEENVELRNKIASMEATSREKRSIGTIDSIDPFDTLESDMPIDSLDDIADLSHYKGRTPRSLVSLKLVI